MEDKGTRDKGTRVKQGEARIGHKYDYSDPKNHSNV